MSEITRTFKELQNTGRKGFIPFITAGDPDLNTTLAIMKELAALESTVIELGVPFTDPMADGPVIQASSKRALEGEKPVTVADVLSLVSQFRKFSKIPVVVFGYLNPFMGFGIQRMAEECKKAGVDGVLITDVVDDEFRAISKVFASEDIDLISLVAPTTSEARLRRILCEARGFVYAISTRGVTGGDTLFADAQQLVTRIKTLTALPVAVGFGLSNRQDIEEIWQYADAAVVGSAIVRTIAASDSPKNCAGEVRTFVKGLLNAGA